MDYSMPISRSTRFGKPLWCPQRVLFNWFMHSALGRDPDASLCPLPQTITTSIVSLFLETGILHLIVQQPSTFPPTSVHAEHTQFYIKEIELIQQVKASEFQMCSQCISIGPWHKHCKAPGMSDFSVPLPKGLQNTCAVSHPSPA